MLFFKARKLVFQPSKKLQLVMARGLISLWKMPEYFGSDTTMTMDLLWFIMKHLEESGFRARRVSFDLGNKKFQSEFGLHSEVYKVRNPFAPDRWFYFIPDAPHIKEVLGPLCLNKTYLIPKDPYSRLYGQPGEISLREMVQCGDYVPFGTEHFAKILKADTAEFKIHHKLKPAVWR